MFCYAFATKVTIPDWLKLVPGSRGDGDGYNAPTSPGDVGDDTSDGLSFA